MSRLVYSALLLGCLTAPAAAQNRIPIRQVGSGLVGPTNPTRGILPASRAKPYLRRSPPPRYSVLGIGSGRGGGLIDIEELILIDPGREAGHTDRRLVVVYHEGPSAGPRAAPYKLVELPPRAVTSFVSWVPLDARVVRLRGLERRGAIDTGDYATLLQGRSRKTHKTPAQQARLFALLRQGELTPTELTRVLRSPPIAQRWALAAKAGKLTPDELIWLLKAEQQLPRRLRPTPQPKRTEPRSGKPSPVEAYVAGALSLAQLEARIAPAPKSRPARWFALARRKRLTRSELGFLLVGSVQYASVRSGIAGKLADKP